MVTGLLFNYYGHCMHVANPYHIRGHEICQIINTTKDSKNYTGRVKIESDQRNKLSLHNISLLICIDQVRYNSYDVWPR